MASHNIPHLSISSYLCLVLRFRGASERSFGGFTADLSTILNTNFRELPFSTHFGE